MELLHREIDVIPGKTPQAPMPDGRRADPSPGVNRPVTGSGIVRLHNQTNNENAFKVSVRGDGNPYWQSDWYFLEPAPLVGAADGASARRDDHGKGWVKVFVPRGGIRDVHVKFKMMRRPDSRAGTYPIKVIVEPDVVPGQTAAPPATEIEGKVYVAPYYQWEMVIEPEEATVSRRKSKRKTEVAAVIKNESNDWLYCDLTFSKGKDYFGEASTSRVAIPPPESRQTETTRRIPLLLETKLKDWRGNPVPAAIQIQALRVHAPSVAPIPSAMNLTGMENGAVVAVDAPAQDSLMKSGAASLIYRPPIPISVADFPKWLVANAKGLFFFVLGLGAMVYATLLVIASFVGPHKMKFAELNGLKVSKEGIATVSTETLLALPLETRLADSRFSVQTLNDKGQPLTPDSKDPVTAEAGKGPQEKAQGSPGVVNPMASLSELRNYARLDLSKYNNQNVRIWVRRGGMFKFLPFGVSDEKVGDITVGTPPAPPEPPKTVKLTAGKIENGKVSVAVFGAALNDPPYKVVVGTQTAEASLTDDHKAFIVSVPPGTAPGTEINIVKKDDTLVGTAIIAADATPPLGPSDLPPLPPGGAPTTDGGQSGGQALPPNPNNPVPPDSAQKNGGQPEYPENGDSANKPRPTPPLNEDALLAKLNEAYAEARSPALADTPRDEAESLATKKPNCLVAQSAIAFIYARAFNTLDADEKTAAKMQETAKKAYATARKLSEKDNDPVHQALFQMAQAEVLDALKRPDEAATSRNDAKQMEGWERISNLLK